MGIIASANAGKSLDSFSDKVSPLFAKFYGIALILSIGPLLALPRTGATAYEVTFFHAGFTTPIWKYLYLGIYFLLTLLFSLKSSKVVDKIGKILTPAGGPCPGARHNRSRWPWLSRLRGGRSAPSAAPLSVCCASLPSAALLLLVHRRMKERSRGQRA